VISKIVVCARLRPIIPEDHKSTVTIRNAPEICVHLKADGQTIKLVQNLYSSRNFKVDHTFDTAAGQVDVYFQSLKPIVTDVLAGYNGTGIVYGQTGSGM
jgi:kinesin family protein 5